MLFDPNFVVFCVKRVIPSVISLYYLRNGFKNAIMVNVDNLENKTKKKEGGSD